LREYISLRVGRHNKIRIVNEAVPSALEVAVAAGRFHIVVFVVAALLVTRRGGVDVKAAESLPFYSVRMRVTFAIITLQPKESV